MSRGPYFAAVVAATTFALAAPAGAAPTKPVSALQPRATAKLWHELVHRRHLARRTAACTPLRLVFYAPIDWLGLATKLAADQAPCTDYYISIPPLAAEKTTFRPDQPWRIRALGPNFHAVAEISYHGWSSWVAASGGTWYAAGVEARRRMAAAGFDVAAGDTWSVNESSSGVRTGAGAARRNLRDLVRGLYDAGGAGAPRRGIVFVIGVGQSATDLALYKGTLELWYADGDFWNGMSAYVSDWSQEVYGDIRNYAVPGAGLDARSDALNAWLRHPEALAAAGPDDLPAKAFLQRAYSPLANAAWRYAFGSGFGWADVPRDQMEDYVSAQTYALRSGGTNFGFAWSPHQPENETETQFARESGALAGRLAAAIRDSATARQAACAATCTNALSGAWFNNAWKDFSNWSAPALAFANAPLSLAAGAPAGPLIVRLQLAGIVRSDPQPVDVTLASTSAGGSFGPTPDGPWTNTFNVQIAPGSTDASFYYRDTSAGTPAIVASAAGRSEAQQVESVTSSALASLKIAPSGVTLAPGQTQRFSAVGTDAFGNAVTVAPTWAATSGTLAPIGQTSLFTAADLGTATITAAAGGVTATRTVMVAPPMRVARVSYGLRKHRLHVALLVVGTDGQRIASASLRFALRRNGHWFAAASARTNSRGIATVVRPVRRGCYSVKLMRASVRGFAWDRVTPRNGFCAS